MQEPIWLEVPEQFVNSSNAERREIIRTLLDAVSGESCPAVVIPLKPKGDFAVLQLNAGIRMPDAILLQFSMQIVEGFQTVALELLANYTAEEEQELQEIIRAHGEIGAGWGVSEEELALVVPKRLIEQAKTRVGTLFTSTEEPFAAG